MAARTLAGDLLQHRRRAREAVAFFRVSVHPAWLDHLAADRPLSPAEFDRRYLAALPGAVVTPLHRSRGVRWSNERL
jgi:hypothetical protein